eukprot:scaffold126788_cov63-Phaeocystis_antarctica.AAC.2
MHPYDPPYTYARLLEHQPPSLHWRTLSAKLPSNAVSRPPQQHDAAPLRHYPAQPTPFAASSLPSSHTRAEQRHAVQTSPVDLSRSDNKSSPRSKSTWREQHA